MAAVGNDSPALRFRTAAAWDKWLAKHHATSPGVMLQLAKKASGIPSVTHPEALDAALRYGWIDGVRKKHGEDFFLQKFTPRRARSIWSKINRKSALALIKMGRMTPAGLAAVERARKDGRWKAAYASQSRASVPADLQAALERSRRAHAFFNTLDSRNRYAILFRIHSAKKPETRATRIKTFVAMLAKKEKIYP